MVGFPILPVFQLVLLNISGKDHNIMIFIYNNENLVSFAISIPHFFCFLFPLAGIVKTLLNNGSDARHSYHVLYFSVSGNDFNIFPLT